MRKLKMLAAALTAACCVALTACSDDDKPVLTGDYEHVPAGDAGDGSVLGMYLLNEGNLGSNKCTLDYLDLQQSVYRRNIYSDANPEVVMELGDVGNDQIIVDGRLFISVSGSNKVEVLDAYTARTMGHIDVANARQLATDGKYVYVGSYTGAIKVDPAVNAGHVYKVDASTLKIVGEYATPYWPESMAVTGGRLYVATSGSTDDLVYADNDVVVLNTSTMTAEGSITVGTNLNKVRVDDSGCLWISSRGDYMSKPSRLYRVDPKTSAVKTVEVSCTDFSIYKGTIYYYASVWSNATMSMTHDYGTVSVATATPGASFLPAASQAEITEPYGIAVNPANGDIYISDASNYTSSGSLLCFKADGSLRWKVKTGDIPGHMVFLMR